MKTKEYTPNDVWQLLAELSVSQKETSELIKKNSVEADKRSKEVTEKIKEAVKMSKEATERSKEATERSKEAAVRFKKMELKWQKADLKFERIHNEIQTSQKRAAKLDKQVGGIGNSNGEVAENFFYQGFINNILHFAPLLIVFNNYN